MSATVLHGDCIEQMRLMADASVDSIVTDPPYLISFMGATWDSADGIAGKPEVWREALRVLKPGGHMLAFGAPRTYHRMTCAIEDAGFEIRDCVMWITGSGFPKSMDVSKQLDLQEKNRWVDVCKAIDKMDGAAILRAWIECSNNVKSAGPTFLSINERDGKTTRSENTARLDAHIKLSPDQFSKSIQSELDNAKLAGTISLKNTTETGTSTQRSVFAPGHVQLSVSPERSHASAVIAELNSSAAPRTTGENWLSAQLSAAASTTALSAHVIIAEPSPGSREVTPGITGSSALCGALAFLGESTSHMVRAVEALTTWLGSKPSSRVAATNALCAELTDALKLITLSQSETFRSLDTKSQTDFASATTVTITEFTAESLISYTADILRNKAIDKMAGAEREVIGPRVYADGTRGHWAAGGVYAGDEHTEELKATRAGKIDTAPATPEAAQWAGWGTALKPAHEPIVVARKPLIGTVAQNVMKYGCGALNIDACRVGTDEVKDADRTRHSMGYHGGNDGSTRHAGSGTSHAAGRWPANVIHSGSDDVLDAFAAFGESKSRVGKPRGSANPGDGWGMTKTGAEYDDAGSAARFFYSAKASKADRADSKHPTVKPISLMRYLCRLVTPPGGTILDCFAGSGTTLQAALEEGFQAIGIEREAEYHADILRRMERVRMAMEKPAPAPKAKKIRVAKPKKAPADPTWPTLFDLMVCEAA
jgi:DNA modification methylase